MTFSELGLNAALLQSLAENNISTPSEIQEKAIPFILTETKNLVAVAQTGTGKTAAFGLPVLQQIDPKLQQTQVLVLVPTRELAQQVAKDLFVFSRYIVRIHTEAVYGGKKIEENIKKLEVPRHILIATPGRLLDLMDRKIVDLSYLKFIILDEADEMLNMGFEPDIDKIVRACKPNIRKLLFTSTFDAGIKSIARKYMGVYVEEMRIKPQEYVNRNIEHEYIAYQYGYKLEYLKAFLLNHTKERGIIFCRTQAATKLLAQQLKGFDVVADAIYGDLNQYERTKVMNAFKDKRIHVLIATDVAARGIDVQDLNYVIHYHLPDNEAQYVNRSGRTARAGKKGVSICMLQEDEVHHKDDFEDALHIKFAPVKLNVVLDKTEPRPVTLTINVGTRHEQDADKLKAFLVFYSGVKEEAISHVLVYRAHTTFEVESKYKNQLINNIHHTKHFHQRIVVEESSK
jgi:ATP-dependent RNA helicase DeaD